MKRLSSQVLDASIGDCFEVWNVSKAAMLQFGQSHFLASWTNLIGNVGDAAGGASKKSVIVVVSSAFSWHILG